MTKGEQLFNENIFVQRVIICVLYIDYSEYNCLTETCFLQTLAIFMGEKKILKTIKR